LPSPHVTDIGPTEYQKVKSNKKDCQRLASRGTKIVGDIWRQTKDFGVDLPVEARESVEEIEGSVFFEQNSRAWRDIDIRDSPVVGSSATSLI
jgi:hypothetical protein